MAMHNPKGRANYEPNSWGSQGGPRETASGYQSMPETLGGSKVRARSETFSDHYSQARQFYISQTEIEQTHIASALVFELSKVETLAIRTRMVSHLRNIDDELAAAVTQGLRLKQMPEPAVAARPTLRNLAPSPSLSLLKNGPTSFAGRKVGVIVTDGVDATLLEALRTAIKTENATLKLVAPQVGGVKDSSGTWHDADEQLDGAPSVLFDAIAILPSDEGGRLLATLPAARQSVADAVIHCKFVAYATAAMPLLEKAGVALDEGVIALEQASDCTRFVESCRQLRYWDRAASGSS
jgi:catalase